MLRPRRGRGGALYFAQGGDADDALTATAMTDGDVNAAPAPEDEPSATF